jgi:REP element-mobilizing transposase RayT
MPSPVPLQHDQYYHVYNRGNNREDIFIDERNYRYFLELYAKYIEPVADTYAYCLLRNHFHLLVRIKTVEEQEEHVKTLRVSDVPSAETLRVFKPKKPSQQFGNLFNAYAKAINKAYQRTGSLFENPFGRIPVTSDAYYVQLITYIHHNPQKHGFVDDFRLWPYSSYHAMLSEKQTRLKRNDVLAWFNGPAAFQASHHRETDERQIASLVPDDFD